MDDNSSWPEGRPPRSAGLAAFSCSVHCRCREWEFRDLTLTTGVSVVERRCPRCRRRMLIVFRTGEHVGTVELVGHKARSRVTADDVRASLVGALADHEVELLIQMAGA